MEFEEWAKRIKNKFEAHYGGDYETVGDVELSGMDIPLLFKRRDRQPKTLFGIPLSSILPFKTEPLGQEACESVFVLQGRRFDEQALARLLEFIRVVEHVHVRPGMDKSFFFLSIAVLCESMDDKLDAKLRKYKLFKVYPGGDGWMITRVVILPMDGSLHCNKDGHAFANVLKGSVLVGD